jgi:hypothetical protein
MSEDAAGYQPQLRSNWLWSSWHLKFSRCNNLRWNGFPCAQLIILGWTRDSSLRLFQSSSNSNFSYFLESNNRNSLDYLGINQRIITIKLIKWNLQICANKWVQECSRNRNNVKFRDQPIHLCICDVCSLLSQSNNHPKLPRISYVFYFHGHMFNLY